MKPTIYDTAKATGVSKATVSKVINNTGSISDKTRSKIHRIMDELKYQPNRLASAMKGNGNVPDESSRYMLERVKKELT